jgi:hypothetical protein
MTEHRDQPGEGCYMRGSLVINKVAGNLHIALGGRHQHHAHPKKGTPGAPGAPGHPHVHHQAVGHVNKEQPHPPQQQQSHSHQFMLHEMLFFNASHTIHQLQFGKIFRSFTQFEEMAGHIFINSVSPLHCAFG